MKRYCWNSRCGYHGLEIVTHYPNGEPRPRPEHCGGCKKRGKLGDPLTLDKPIKEAKK